MFIKRVWRRLFSTAEIVKSSAEQYNKSGNLRYGQNCNLDRLNISIQQARPDFPNIVIGNDCHISGHVMLHSATARLVIGDGVFIGPDTTIFCYDAVLIGNDVMISWGCTLIDTNAHSLHSAEREADVRDWIKGPEYKNWSVVAHEGIEIQSKCWIGFNSIITKGVILKEGTVIGCGSVVTKSTEPYGIYGGNPAVFIKKTD